MTVATRTTGSANSRSGTTGSGASRSRHTKNTASTTALPASATIAGEAHASSSPPVPVTSTSEMSAAVSSALPP
jgi:hypothetical protein